MPDQSVREIQLSGKQVVFMFMASVVLAVVIFLLGVSVGRGVRTATVTSTTGADVGAPGDTTVPAGAAAGQAQPKPGDLTFHDRLQGQGTPAGAATPPPPPAGDPAAGTAAQAAKPVEPPPPTQPAAQPPPPTSPAASKTEPKPAPTTDKPTTQKPPAQKTPVPGADTFTVQVGAFSTKERADDVVSTLKAKGFPAFAVAQGKLFPVRVGPYADRSDADRAQNRLVKEGFPSSVIR